ncbi:uncharacterized protein [Eurosta solidaginis]|uniref:uncharacterized protein n=1 Tax=Eurosta solidaginis TaxID=178769 RepID=UPI00353062C6
MDRKLFPEAVPDQNLPTNVPDPSALSENIDPNSIVELGTEEFDPIFDSSQLFNEASNLYLLAAVAEESQEEIDLLETEIQLDNDYLAIEPMVVQRGSQTNLSLTSGADREKRLEEQNLKLKTALEEKDRNIIYLKYQLAEMATKVNNLKKELSDLEEGFDSVRNLCSNLPPAISSVVQNSFKNDSRNPKGRRYDSYFKTLALGVFFISPLAYRHLKPLLRFPTERTLEEFVSEWPRDPGCSNSTLKCLELRARGFTQNQKFVSILCDEMALKSHMQYLPKFDKIVGLEDYGDENRTSRIGNSAFALMVQGIGGEPWSHPLAYFIVHNSCDGDVVKKYIFEDITQLQNIGLIPCHFVSDQGSNFKHLANALGVSEERPYFQVNGKDIHFFNDCPHLLKNTRNCLQNSKNRISFKSRPINWSDIVHF